MLEKRWHICNDRYLSLFQISNHINHGYGVDTWLKSGYNDLAGPHIFDKYSYQRIQMLNACQVSKIRNAKTVKTWAEVSESSKKKAKEMAMVP